jgi:hypothetical protein
MQDYDPEQKDPKDRREVDPPIEVQVATWSAAGTLDWWVKEHGPSTEWYGRADLRQAQDPSRP